MTKMRSLLCVCALALSCGALLSQAARVGARAPKFASAYTDLKTQCKPLGEPSDRGDDTPLRCKGYGGYHVQIDFSAASSHLIVMPAGGDTEAHISLAEQPLGYDSKRKIEWRLADGKPFAVILRVDKAREGLDPAEMWRPENKAGEFLLVKGLKGHERIDYQVDAKTTDANKEARRMADRAYLEGR